MEIKKKFLGVGNRGDKDGNYSPDHFAPENDANHDTP